MKILRVFSILQEQNFLKNFQESIPLIKKIKLFNN